MTTFAAEGDAVDLVRVAGNIYRHARGDEVSDLLAELSNGVFALAALFDPMTGAMTAIRVRCFLVGTWDVDADGRATQVSAPFPDGEQWAAFDGQRWQTPSYYFGDVAGLLEHPGTRCAQTSRALSRVLEALRHSVH